MPKEAAPKVQSPELAAIAGQTQQPRINSKTMGKCPHALDWLQEWVAKVPDAPKPPLWVGPAACVAYLVAVLAGERFMRKRAPLKLNTVPYLFPMGTYVVVVSLNARSAISLISAVTALLVIVLSYHSMNSSTLLMSSAVT